MLDDVDRSLAALLGSRLEAEKVEVIFDAPTADWTGSGDRKRVVDLFLHDVREDLTARTADWDDVRGDDGRVLGRQSPPRRYLLSYLVSAWTGDPLEDHRLLGLVLETVLERESIPAELLQGRLRDQGLPVMLQVAVRDLPTPEAFDLWGALGAPLRSSLSLLVAAPLLPQLSTELAPPAERLDLGVRKQDGDRKRAGGTASGADLDGRAGDGAGGAAGAGAGREPVPVGRIVKRWEGIRITEKSEKSENSADEPAPTA